MAGGKGVRFWPLSRAIKAKQFLSVIGSPTLIEQTLERIQHLSKSIWIAGSEQQRKLLISTTKNFKPHLLLEPEGRNTAACVGWSVWTLAQENPDDVVAFLPSDHWVQPNALYRKVIKNAVRLAQSSDNLITIGIKPTLPHTGYGYIETKKKIKEHFSVRTFHEKPNEAIAKTYLETQKHYWNSGIFIGKLSTFVNLFTIHLPDHARLLSKIVKTQHTRGLITKANLATYHQIPSVSFDNGILEKCPEKILMVPAQYNWSDIGNWRSLDPFLKKDAYHNTTSGQVLIKNSKSNMIIGHKKLIAALGIEDLLIVETEDALLITKRSMDQDLRALYDLLPKKYQ